MTESTNVGNAKSAALRAAAKNNTGTRTSSNATPENKYVPHPRNAVVKGRDASEILGTFEVIYLGTLPCEAHTGDDVLLDTAEKLCETRKILKGMCALVITGGGIKAVDSVTSQVISQVNIMSVSFTGNATKKTFIKKIKKHVESCNTVFGYIVKDDSISRKTCSVFGCNSLAIGEGLALAIQKAFNVQKEIMKLHKTNPFGAISSTREASPKSLFSLQIHRADLSAQKVGCECYYMYPCALRISSSDTHSHTLSMILNSMYLLSFR